MHARCEFRSFIQGGFECSSHRRPDGRRLDLLASTQHDVSADRDYSLLARQGIRTCRDGMRWHLMEPRQGIYDFSSFLPMLRAARDNGVQVIWDICHYGWPDNLDIFSPAFVDRFARFCRAVARLVRSETDDTPYFTPINEPSFLSWAGGDQALINPCRTGCGAELKKQLIRATIAGIEAVREEIPHARFVQSDPVIHIVPSYGASAEEIAEARAYCSAQFQAWDMLTGRIFPELGGHPRYLDIVGCNYYIHNQWIYGGEFIERDDARYRPLWRMLEEVRKRYNRPLFISETGIEGERRPEWLRYIVDEVLEALCHGTPVEGICLYPIVNYPGWADDRPCQSGLWDFCNNSGHREIYIPLADEIGRQQERIRCFFSGLPLEESVAGSLV